MDTKIFEGKKNPQDILQTVLEGVKMERYPLAPAGYMIWYLIDQTRPRLLSMVFGTPKSGDEYYSVVYPDWDMTLELIVKSIGEVVREAQRAKESDDMISNFVETMSTSIIGELQLPEHVVVIFREALSNIK